jgi:hypothetical protein
VRLQIIQAKGHPIKEVAAINYRRASTTTCTLDLFLPRGVSGSSFDTADDLKYSQPCLETPLRLSGIQNLPFRSIAPLGTTNSFTGAGQRPRPQSIFGAAGPWPEVCGIAIPANFHALCPAAPGG